MIIRKYALVGVVIFICGMATPSVQAQDSSEKALASGSLYGIRIGLLAHDVGGLWSHARAEGGADVNAEIVFSKPSLKLWQGFILPNIGVSLNSQHDTSKVYGVGIRFNSNPVGPGDWANANNNVIHIWSQADSGSFSSIGRPRPGMVPQPLTNWR